MNHALSSLSPNTVVAVAVSGGVDSLCAMVMLRSAGFQVLALHGIFLPEAPLAPPPGLDKACSALGVPLHVLDLRDVFRREVLDPFAVDYAAGRTPNPCAHCNRTVKFGALLDAALALGAEKLATGHYARLVCSADNDQTPHGADTAKFPLLAAAHDDAKDQSYFLSMVPNERLSHALFPLYGQSKEKTRAIVAAAGLTVPLPRESQDICFAPPMALPNQSAAETYRPFLEAHWRGMNIIPAGPGPVLLSDASGGKHEIARHKGLWRYTEGQRKGLGIAHSEPLFVLAKNCLDNSLIVGPRALLGITSCVAGSVNVALPPHLWPDTLLIRLRHRQPPAPARVTFEDEFMHIRFVTPQFPTAPGQVAAVYDQMGRVLAAGIIETMC